MSLEEFLGTPQKSMHLRVQRRALLVEPQRMELLAPHVNDLGDRGAHTAAFVAKQREQSYRGSALHLGDVEESRDVQWCEQHRETHDYDDSRPDHLPRADVQ